MDIVAIPAMTPKTEAFETLISYWATNWAKRRCSRTRAASPGRVASSGDPRLRISRLPLDTMRMGRMCSLGYGSPGILRQPSG